MTSKLRPIARACVRNPEQLLRESATEVREHMATLARRLSPALARPSTGSFPPRAAEPRGAASRPVSVELDATSALLLLGLFTGLGFAVGILGLLARF